MKLGMARGLEQCSGGILSTSKKINVVTSVSVHFSLGMLYYLHTLKDSVSRIRDYLNILDSEAQNPILDIRISCFVLCPPCSRSGYPPLKYEMGWTGELWSNRVLLILKN